VNFQSESESEGNKEEDDWEEKPAAENREDGTGSPPNKNIEDDVELRKGLLQDMSKHDARYAIIMSRLDNDQRKPRQTGSLKTRKSSESSKKKPRFMGSMIADLEEKTTNDLKRRKMIERRQDRRRLVESARLQPRHRRGNRNNKGRKPSDDDEDVLSVEQVQKLTEESRRLKVQELTRKMATAQDSDLRSLLNGRRRKGSNSNASDYTGGGPRAAVSKKVSSSDDEEIVERKLREKIKEEKHLRLFGKLGCGDRDRLHSERERLRKRLEKAHRKHLESMFVFYSIASTTLGALYLKSLEPNRSSTYVYYSLSKIEIITVSVYTRNLQFIRIRGKSVSITISNYTVFIFI